MDEELSPAPALAWDQVLLAPIVELNERVLECLQHTALTAAPHARAELPALIAQLWPEWCALQPAALRRVARCPYLFVDAGFAEPLRWQPHAGAAVHDVARLDREPFLPGAPWSSVTRRTLMLGWHLARAQPLAARVLLGMSAAAAECIAACGLTDLEALAEQASGRVVPRWAAAPLIWRQLLRASQAPDEQLRWTQLRGLQLLAATASEAALASSA